MRTCNNCGAPLDDDALFCPECRSKREKEEKTCPECGATIDDDSTFCSECGAQLNNQFVSQYETRQQPAMSEQPIEEIVKDGVVVEENTKKKSWGLIGLIIGLIVLACGVGGYFYYNNLYLPEKIDREAPRYYTMANAVVLRSSKSSGADYNKVGSLPYGTELITYEQDSEWSKVKVSSVNSEGTSQEGFVASSLLLSKPDFFLLNSAFGDQESKENVFTTKCRLAVLNYYKTRGYIGKIDDQLRRESGIQTTPDSDNQWQIFCRPKEVKPNNVFFKRLYDRNSRFTDFAVIIKNLVSGERKLLYFYFDEDESPHFLSEQDAPSEGYIKDIVKTGYGELIATYTN